MITFVLIHLAVAAVIGVIWGASEKDYPLN